MTELVDAALSYARRGWCVFPVHGVYRGLCTCGRRDCSSVGKHPLVRHGVHEASKDSRVIQEWWRRWRLANVAVATGNASGIVVVDIDLPSALGSLESVVERLVPTLTGLTGGGGLHLVYFCDHSIGNSTGGLPGDEGELPGIDLRGDGGYIVAPPSRHVSGCRYEWLDADRVISVLPHWLAEQRRATASICVAGRAKFVGDGSAYGLHVLHDEIARLGRAPQGRRNHELNSATFAVARVVAGGELLETAARAALWAKALRIGLGEHEIRLTIDSAFRAGSDRPRSAPHRLTIGERRPSGDAGPAAD